MARLDILKQRRDVLKEEIVADLDSFLIGTVNRSPAMRHYGLTTKVEGKTVSLYVRQGMVERALDMATRYKRLWLSIQKLSKLNFEILKLECE